MFPRRPLLWLSCSAVAFVGGLLAVALMLGGSDLPRGVYVPWRERPVDPFLAPYMIEPDAGLSAIEGGVGPDRVRYINEQYGFHADAKGTIINLQRFAITPVRTHEDLRFMLEGAERSVDLPGGLADDQEAGLLTGIERALEQHFWPDAERYIAWAERRGATKLPDNVLYTLYPQGVPVTRDWRDKVRLLDAALRRRYGPGGAWTGLAPAPLEVRIRRFETEEGYLLARELMRRAVRWSGITLKYSLAEAGPAALDRLRGGQEVLIADVLLLARHRKAPALTSPYMLRLSWNDAHGVWQPEELIGFIHSPEVKAWGLF